MKLLIIGGGGREHALAWKLAQSPRVASICCAPGNAGTAALGENVPLAITDAEGLRAFAQRRGIDLTVVGPDDALAAGIVDHFQAAGLRIFGPTRAAARLEWSKIFTKDFLLRHGIPTAAAGRFERSADARRFCAENAFPLVIKADGLATGKGVIIAEDFRAADAAIGDLMEAERFGEAGRRVLIEEFLQGAERSVHALVDGASARLLPLARDYKRIGDGDTGANTGGMGAISAADPELEERIEREVLRPTLAGLRQDGIDFRGMLFPGVMLTADGPKVLEFNARFGDPETQALLPRLRSDLLPALEATIDGGLDGVTLDWDPRPSACVILVSGGYPGTYETGRVISGLDAALPEGVFVFHAGTARDGGGRVVTSGGRVLGVTALGESVEEARGRAYAAAERIVFEGRWLRRDIGS